MLHINRFPNQRFRKTTGREPDLHKKTVSKNKKIETEIFNTLNTFRLVSDNTNYKGTSSEKTKTIEKDYC